MSPSTASTQQRQPAGVPVGGQYAETARSTSGIALDDDVDVEELTEVSYRFPAERFAIAQRKVEAANRRLERAGIDERFETSHEVSTEYVTDKETGATVRRDYVTLTLDRPTISHDGYEFLARIDTTESGKLVAMAAPGQELDGWEPESIECEHCQTRRARKNVYAVRGPDGDVTVVGSSCLAPFLGVRPAGLWTLEWAELDKLENEWGQEDRDGTYGGTPVAPSSTILSTAYAIAKRQGGYRNAYDDHPTSHLVRRNLFPYGRKDNADQEWDAQVQEEAQRVDVSDLRARINEAIGDSDSDWADKIRLFMDEEYVSERHTAVLASAVSAVERAEARNREYVAPAKGFVAPVGEKVTGEKAKVLKLREFTRHYGGRESTTQLVRMQTEAGHIITWWASRPQDVEEGQEVIVDRATVKQHEEYNGEDQTVVTRAKLSVVDTDV